MAAPLLYSSATQVNAVVPYEVAGSAVASLVLESNGQRFRTGVPVSAAAPAIFNSGITSPVARGSIIQFFATGLGQTYPASITGEVNADGFRKPVLPVSVMIGGVSAAVLGVGSVPGDVAGIFALTVVVPTAVAPGSAVPVVVVAGPTKSSGTFTIAVQ